MARWLAGVMTMGMLAHAQTFEMASAKAFGMAYWAQAGPNRDSDKLASGEPGEGANTPLGTLPEVTEDWGKVVIHFSPIGLVSSEASIGPAGREAGLWQCAVCNRSNVPVVVPRGEVIAASKSIRYIPDGHWQPLLSRRETRNGTNKAKAVAKVLIPVGAAVAGFAFGGAAIGAMSGVGASSTVSQIFSTAKDAEASVSSVEYKLKEPIPASIAVPANDCREFELLSTLVRAAAKHTVVLK